MSQIFLQKKYAAAVFAAMLLFLGVGSSAVAASGPEETVRLLQQGIDARDFALVEKHLDIDGLVGKGLRQMLADPEFVALAAKNPAIAVVLALGGNASANDALHTLLVAEARSYVGHGVTSGAFAGVPDHNAAPYRGLFGRVFRGGEKDKKVFGPAKLLRGAKDGPAVTTALHDGTKGRVYPLTLRLEKRGEDWRVVELLNLADFIREAKKREGQ